MFGFFNTLLLEGCSITLAAPSNEAQAVSVHILKPLHLNQPNPTHTQKPAASGKVVYKKKAEKHTWQPQKVM